MVNGKRRRTVLCEAYSLLGIRQQCLTANQAQHLPAETGGTDILHGKRQTGRERERERDDVGVRPSSYTTMSKGEQGALLD